jgi:hypothetical protein
VILRHRHMIEIPMPRHHPNIIRSTCIVCAPPDDMAEMNYSTCYQLRGPGYALRPHLRVETSAFSHQHPTLTIDISLTHVISTRTSSPEAWKITPAATMRARLHPGEIVLLPGGSQTSWQNVLASIGAERLSVCLLAGLCTSVKKDSKSPAYMYLSGMMVLVRKLKLYRE